MRYLTQSTPLKFKAYGRGIQQLIAEVAEIPDRNLRQQQAERIVEAMAVVSGYGRPTPEQQQKLWSHLACMANYSLDIDFPCPIEQQGLQAQPLRIDYPAHQIRLRHYGHYLEQLTAQLGAMPTTEERAPIIRLIAARMRRHLLDQGSQQNCTERIAHDIEQYTKGLVTAEEVGAALQRH